jgi:rfaE bifunctional protein kinase chain/domain
MKQERLEELIKSFSKVRICVVGDVMLDEFVSGKVSRISPEAPVPVVDVTEENFYPGGAANVARNLAEFTKGVHIMGLIGGDRTADRLKLILQDEGVKLDALIEDPTYTTIVKTRIIARQHVVRIDREQKRLLTPEQIESALATIERLMPNIDGIIVQDYAKGFLGPDLVSRLCTMANRVGKILAVDPNPKNPLTWEHVTVIKPNRAEAFAAAGIPASDPVEPATNDAALLQVGDTLMKRWNSDQLIITLGEQGLMLFQSNEKPPYHAPARAREVYDVSGAGDTVIALYTLALCAGATPEEAAEIANHASGIVVGKLGTATCTPGELRSRINGEAQSD